MHAVYELDHAACAESMETSTDTRQVERRPRGRTLGHEKLCAEEASSSAQISRNLDLLLKKDAQATVIYLRSAARSNKTLDLKKDIEGDSRD
jgi:hypothetical protein